MSSPPPTNSTSSGFCCRTESSGQRRGGRWEAGVEPVHDVVFPGALRFRRTTRRATRGVRPPINITSVKLGRRPGFTLLLNGRVSDLGGTSGSYSRARQQMPPGDPDAGPIKVGNARCRPVQRGMNGLTRVDCGPSAPCSSRTLRSSRRLLDLPCHARVTGKPPPCRHAFTQASRVRRPSPLSMCEPARPRPGPCGTLAGSPCPPGCRTPALVAPEDA